jgi:alpha-D-xyloside xylohydrolase
MKFTDGFWLVRDGYSMRHATHVQRAELLGEQGAISALIAPRVVENRGATLNIGTLDLRLDSPLDDVVRVRVAHHRGGKPALTYAITEHSPRVTLEGSEDSVSLTTGRVQARLSTSTSWKLSFEADGKVFAEQGAKGLSIVDAPGGKRFLSSQISLKVGENVYGLGERFTSFIKNGQTVDIWNADGGTSSEQAYKNIPFYLTNEGYGVFVNHTGLVSFEVASEAVEKVQFSAETEDIEYFVIYGPTPKEILEKYTALTGRAPVLPEWSFGLWLSTSFVTNYDEGTVSQFIDEMSAQKIPLSVFHFDCFWMREYQWCDFQWDPRTFPDPEGMLARLKAKGLRISLWINPYIGQASPLFDEARVAGYLLKRADGSVWQWDLWQAGNSIVDFTNPAAREWFKSKLRPLLKMGVDCFKTDFGERIPTDVIYFDGSNPEQMHNLYTQIYNETVWEVLQELKGDEAIVFARSAAPGGQKMPVHWGGDNTSTFESMAESLRGGLSLSLSGFGYWSHDIGGFEGTPNPAVFKRWIAFGLLSSHSRLHGNESVRVPWSIDEESVSVTRKFATLKSELLPYIMKVAAEEVHGRGTPLMRPMLVEFPEDRTTWFLDQQYMFGPDLLVAPVFTESGEVEFYLPAGKWKNYFTHEVINGGKWLKESHGFDSLPLYIREDSKYLTH